MLSRSVITHPPTDLWETASLRLGGLMRLASTEYVNDALGREFDELAFSINTLRGVTPKEAHNHISLSKEERLVTFFITAAQAVELLLTNQVKTLSLPFPTQIYDEREKTSALSLTFTSGSIAGEPITKKSPVTGLDMPLFAFDIFQGSSLHLGIRLGNYLFYNDKLLEAVGKKYFHDVQNIIQRLDKANCYDQFFLAFGNVLTKNNSQNALVALTERKILTQLIADGNAGQVASKIHANSDLRFHPFAPALILRGESDLHALPQYTVAAYYTRLVSLINGMRTSMDDGKPSQAKLFLAEFVFDSLVTHFEFSEESAIRLPARNLFKADQYLGDLIFRKLGFSYQSNLNHLAQIRNSDLESEIGKLCKLFYQDFISTEEAIGKQAT